MAGVVIPCVDRIDTKASELSEFRISRSDLGAYLTFFDSVGYFSGHRPGAMFARLGGEPFKMILPNDPALNNADQPLIRPFFTIDPEESVSHAMVYQMKNGYSSEPEKSWIYHPKYFETNEAIDICGGKISPSVGLTFLDGIWCPPDSTPLEDVIRFREARASEHAAFMEAIFSTSEGLTVESNSLVLNTPIRVIEDALAELNRTSLEKWVSCVKRSFKWGVRLNEKSLPKLAGAVAGYDYLGNMTSSVLLGLWGMVEFSVDLTPQIDTPGEFTKAISFAWDAEKQFGGPNFYTRYRLKKGRIVS